MRLQRAPRPLRTWRPPRSPMEASRRLAQFSEGVGADLDELIPCPAGRTLTCFVGSEWEGRIFGAVGSPVRAPGLPSRFDSLPALLRDLLVYRALTRVRLDHSPALGGSLHLRCTRRDLSAWLHWAPLPAVELTELIQRRDLPLSLTAYSRILALDPELISLILRTLREGRPVLARAEGVLGPSTSATHHPTSLSAQVAELAPLDARWAHSTRAERELVWGLASSWEGSLDELLTGAANILA